jgi:3-phenylpropionate/cinnamic acid dioxygenase small subunit
MSATEINGENLAMTGTLEDHEQIRDLYARYAYTIDYGPPEEWISCFTEDGVFESPRFGRHSGSDGLRRFVTMSKEANGSAKVRHMLTNVAFQINGDTATGACYLTYYHCKNGKATLEALGRYEDELRKVNGDWLFRSRRVHVDGHF